MDSTVLAAMVSSISAIVVCVISNWFQNRKTEKAHQDNNGNLVRTLVDE